MTRLRVGGSTGVSATKILFSASTGLRHFSLSTTHPFNTVAVGQTHRSRSTKLEKPTLSMGTSPPFRPRSVQSAALVHRSIRRHHSLANSITSRSVPSPTVRDDNAFSCRHLSRTRPENFRRETRRLRRVATRSPPQPHPPPYKPLRSRLYKTTTTTATSVIFFVVERLPRHGTPYRNNHYYDCSVGLAYRDRPVFFEGLFENWGRRRRILSLYIYSSSSGVEDKDSVLRPRNLFTLIFSPNNDRSRWSW